MTRLEDRFALNDLVATYCHLVDDREYDRLVMLFAPDAQFFREDVLAASGRAALRTFYRTACSVFTSSFHYPHSHVVTFASAEAASGIVSAHAEMGIDGALVLAGLRYDDRYVKQQDGWRFAERRVHFRYRSPWHELSATYGSAKP